MLQFKRIPFELTNAEGAFQRKVTQIIKEDGLVGTGTNKVSGTSEYIPLEPPVHVIGAGKSSLGENQKKITRLHIFKGRNLGDGFK